MTAQPTTTSLSTWVAAMLDASEALALAATPGPWIADFAEGTPDWEATVLDSSERGLFICEHGTQADCGKADAAHIAAQDPATVLARVAADRKILALHDGRGSEDDCSWRSISPCPTLRALASQFAGAEGWREEWS